MPVFFIFPTRILIHLVKLNFLFSSIYGTWYLPLQIFRTKLNHDSYITVVELHLNSKEVRLGCPRKNKNISYSLGRVGILLRKYKRRVYLDKSFRSCFIWYCNLLIYFSVFRKKNFVAIFGKLPITPIITNSLPIFSEDSHITRLTFLHSSLSRYFGGFQLPNHLPNTSFKTHLNVEQLTSWNVCFYQWPLTANIPPNLLFCTSSNQYDSVICLLCMCAPICFAQPTGPSDPLALRKINDHYFLALVRVGTVGRRQKSRGKWMNCLPVHSHWGRIYILFTWITSPSTFLLSPQAFKRFKGPSILENCPLRVGTQTHIHILLCGAPVCFLVALSSTTTTTKNSCCSVLKSKCSPNWLSQLT